MKNVSRWTAAMAACLCVMPAQAQQKTPAQAASQKTPAKPPSPFILCDGRTGHVGLGEALARLAAITVTAGLSETVTRQDDANQRLDGIAAAAACQTAIEQEGNNLRRVELGMARSIHLIAADRLADALNAIRAVPSLAGALENDAGYRRTLKPRVDLLEAEILARQHQAAEAQAVAVRAVASSPYDVALAQKAVRLMRLTASLDAGREQAFEQMDRIMPQIADVHVSVLLGAGQLKQAAALLDAIPAACAPFATEWHPEPWQATRALVLALDGRQGEARALADRVRSQLTSLAGSGYAIKHAGSSAAASEALALTDIILDAAQGRGSQARATFRAHGPWLLVDQLAVPIAVDRLRLGAPASELTGDLAQTPAALRERFFAQMMAALADKDRIKPLFDLAQNHYDAGDFRGASGVTWKTGAKPKLLMKPFKEQVPGTDVISGGGRVVGLVAGEAVLLHAALIARDRGFNRVIIMPARTNLEWVIVRYGNQGQPDVPDALSLDVARTVADISLMIPDPATMRR